MHGRTRSRLLRLHRNIIRDRTDALTIAAVAAAQVAEVAIEENQTGVVGMRCE